VGVLGKSHSANAAVRGINDNAGPGIHGISAAGPAGLFEGDLKVLGEVTAYDVMLNGTVVMSELAEQVKTLTTKVGLSLTAIIGSWHADSRTKKDRLHIAAGRTAPGATDWVVYTPQWISVDVDTSAGQLSGTPV
jgi:hypothetical protein